MSHTPSRAATLDAAATARCRSLLSQRMSVLRVALRDQSDVGHSSANEPSAAEVHDLKDEAFAGQLANLRGVTLDQLRSELAAARAALGRIDEGSYGRCGDCDAEIGRERLLAQPSAARCLGCQERAERPHPVR